MFDLRIVTVNIRANKYNKIIDVVPKRIIRCSRLEPAFGFNNRASPEYILLN